jgi:uncharacterized protein with von Willebrand factor type A (vWA) domain
MSRLPDNLLIFGRVLRRAGIDVHPGRLLDVIEALGHVHLGARDEVYHTCRALLVHRQDQIAVFDRAFAAFWRIHHEERPAASRHPASRPSQQPRSTSGPGRSGADVRRRRGRRQPSNGHKRPEDLEQSWRTRRQGLRRIHDRRNSGGGSGPVSSRLASWRTPDAAVGSRPRLANRSSTRDRRESPHGR